MKPTHKMPPDFGEYARIREECDDLLRRVRDESAEELPLAVGMTLFAEFADPGTGGRIYLRLLGWKERHVLICEIPPRVGPRLPKPLVGVRAVVRYMLSGDAVGFRTEITGVHVTPMPLLSIQWPGTFEIVRMRKERRLPITVPCTIRPGGAVIHGVLRDLSIQGGRVLVDEALPVGTRGKVSFCLPDDRSVDGLSAEVKNCTRTAHGHELGVAFDDAADDTLAKIYSFVDDLLYGGQPEKRLLI